MFPDKFVMLREHFRCVEPIIQFSTQFYTEALVPLRIPTAHERIDPPLVDIYVPDGRRTGDKINLREAQVIVAEVLRIIESPGLSRVGDGDRWRSIGVISLIGSKQAALINRMLLEALGEETILRHRISCGDSATFQGNERDIIFLSMVADPASKQAQTALHFEQRFNVAMSRARDRMYLVRSVREEELKPDDLKAKVLRHFRDPMKGSKRPEGDMAALCNSDASAPSCAGSSIADTASRRKSARWATRSTLWWKEPEIGAWRSSAMETNIMDRSDGRTTWRDNACSNASAGGSGDLGH